LKTHKFNGQLGYRIYRLLFWLAIALMGAFGAGYVIARLIRGTM
jgi:hypothetical protein